MRGVTLFSGKLIIPENALIPRGNQPLSLSVSRPLICFSDVDIALVPGCQSGGDRASIMITGGTRAELSVTGERASLEE